MGQQDDFIEQTAEILISPFVGLKVGQDGTGSHFRHFILSAGYRSHLIQRDPDSQGADQLSVAGDQESLFALPPQDRMGGIAEEHHLVPLLP